MPFALPVNWLLMRCRQRTQYHRFAVAWLRSLSQWQRLRPRQAALGCRLVRTRYGHPLRFYITLHFVKCAPVATQSSAWCHPPLARPGAFACAPYGSASTWALVSALPRSGASQRPAGRSSRVSPRPPLCFAAARHQHGAGCPIRPARVRPQARYQKLATA